MSKVKKVFLLIIPIALITMIIIGNTNDNEVYQANNKSKAENNKSNTFAFMLETSIGSGEYTPATDSALPGNGYIFNETRSKCENGSKLLWDDTKKKVVMKGNISDKCYAYFDKTPLKVGLDVKVKNSEGTDYRDNYISKTLKTSAVSESSPAIISGNFLVTFDFSSLNDLIQKRVEQICFKNSACEENTYITGDIDIHISRNVNIEVLNLNNIMNLNDYSGFDVNFQKYFYKDDKNYYDGLISDSYWDSFNLDDETKSSYSGIYLKAKIGSNSSQLSTASFKLNKEWMFTTHTFSIPFTVSTTELFKSKYYTFSAFLDGKLSIVDPSGNVDEFTFVGEQIPGLENNLPTSYLKSWEKPSASVAFIRQSSGGSSGSPSHD